MGFRGLGFWVQGSALARRSDFYTVTFLVAGWGDLYFGPAACEVSGAFCAQGHNWDCIGTNNKGNNISNLPSKPKSVDGKEAASSPAEAFHPADTCPVWAAGQ